MTSEPPLPFFVKINPDALEISVEIHFPATSSSSLQVDLPTWVPGDYEFQPYIRDLFDLAATNSETGKSLTIERQGQNSFIIGADGGPVTLCYTASSYEPSSGDAMGLVDSNYAVLMGTRYLFPQGYGGPYQVTYEPPPGWPIHHPSGATRAEIPNTWIYPDYEILLDTPVIFGDFDLKTREIRGIPFYFAFVDRAIGYEKTVDKFVDQVAVAVEKIHDVFGLFPFSDYTFVLSMNPQADWGLEHLTSNLSGLGPTVFVDPRDYASGIRVCAHELFHAWNVRRLRPAPLGQLSRQLSCGCFTEGLWMAEGFTRYYEFLISTRAQAYSADQFFSAIINYYQHLENEPASRRVTATDSSLATYMNHAKYPGRVNNSIDYYDKGLLIAFGLDSHFRTKGTGNLDTAFREFYLKFFGTGDSLPPDYLGYTTQDVLEFFEKLEPGLGRQLDGELNGTTTLPVKAHFESIGFEVLTLENHALGLFFLNNEGPEIYGVADTGAGGKCGLAPGDIITGVNGYDFNWSGLTWAAAHAEPVLLNITRGHRQLTFQLTPQKNLTITGLKWRGTPAQQALISQWLGDNEFSPGEGEILPVNFYENFHGIETMV